MRLMEASIEEIEPVCQERAGEVKTNYYFNFLRRKRE